MKRFFSVLLCLLMLCLSLAGCGSSAKSLDIAQFSQSVIKDIDFGDELLLVPEKIVCDYYTLPENSVSEYAIYVSATSATASEFAVFKCKDEDALKSVKSAVEKRVAEQTESYENYRPDEKFRLDNALIATDSNYLVFAVSNDNAALQKMFSQSLK